MLFAAYDKGSRDALVRLGVKLATVPTARVVTPGSGIRGPASAGLSSMMRPMRRAVGLAGLGAAGAVAYGLHHQNEEDREHQNLVYAPMAGM